MPSPLANIQVVNLRNSEYDIYIGRGSKWGNPLKIGINGSREDVIHQYKDMLLHNKILLASLKELDGKRLGCFCKPLACHGDILIEFRELQLQQGL